MRKNKIVGIAVASLGAAVSIGSAFALYQKGFGTTQGIGFGGFSYVASDGAFTFLSTLNGGNTGFSVESGTAALSPEAGHTTVTYTFKIAASYGTGANNLIKQDAILGKLSITKSGAAASYLSMSAYVDGYASRMEESVEQNYWAKSESLSVRTLGGEGNTISAYIPTPTSNVANIADAVSAGKFLTVHVTLTFSSTDEQFINLDEGAYSLVVSYTDVDADYERPYIVGDGTGWALEDEYAMVPNLGASSYEFCFKDLNSDANHTFSQMKILKNIGAKDASDIWNSEKWQALGASGDVSSNISCDASTTYFVTHKGNSNGFVVDGNNIYQVS